MLAAAIDCRNLGVTPAELVDVAKRARKTSSRHSTPARSRDSRAMWASNPAKLAADYQALVYEIVSRIAQYESASADYESDEAARLAAVGR